MIKIFRSGNGPSALQKLGSKQTQLDCAAYDVCPADYQSGKAKFKNQSYYNKTVVKDCLIKMHRSKCCYCEKRLRSRGYLHVEHFRPKAGVRQTRTQVRDELPGYYWLAYSWENLLLSCLDCNCIHKRTLFPLANPTDRARSHHDDVTREHPLFIDPAGQEPRDHIRFDDDVPRGITREGTTTIDGIGLRRVELREDRVALLNQIRIHKNLLDLAAANPGSAEIQVLAKEARKFIHAAMQPDAEFSSMVIDFVARHGL